jgi:glycosyltransferase involved in cell wall biosynthesis
MQVSGGAAVRPSVLFVNRVYFPEEGATGRLLGDLAHWLAGAGWRVTVLACGQAESRSADGPVDLVRAAAPDGRSGRATLAQLRALAGAAHQLPPADLTVTMTDPPLLALLGPGLKRRGSALVHWCHDLYPDLLGALGMRLAGPIRTALGGLAARAMSAHDATIAIGPAMADRLAARRRPPPRLTVIPNWADPAIRPDPPGAAAFRRAHGLAGRLVAMYAGNFGRLYDFRPLLDAAAALARRRPGLVLALVGEGARRAETQAEAARRGLGNVRFIPTQPRSRLAACLGAADLHLALMPDAALGCMEPCKVAGILAAGRPCVFLGPADSHAARLIGESGAGQVLRPHDASGLAAAIERLADNPGLRAAMASRAAAVAAPLGLETAAPAFQALALDLLEAGRAPGRQPAEPAPATPVAIAGPANG